MMHPYVRHFFSDPMLLVIVYALLAVYAWALLWIVDRFAGSQLSLVSVQSGKMVSIEGLRGILACAVVIHHTYCWFIFLGGAEWSSGGSILFMRMASFGVIQFFYLSGYLFWRKLIKAGNIRLVPFYLSRWIRIAPAYFACVGLALLVGVLSTGFTLREPIRDMAFEILRWGFFSLLGRPRINGINMMRITCGVTWTLALEWLFYFSLPLLGWFARRNRRLWILFALFGLMYLSTVSIGSHSRIGLTIWGAINLLSNFGRFMFLGFGGGILVATNESRIRDWTHRLGNNASWILLGCSTAYLLIPGNGSTMGMVLEVFLLPAFALVVGGTDLFGFLVWRPIRLLGVISYPIYLVHGVIFYAAMKLRGGMHAVPLPTYMAQSALCIFCVLVMAMLVHIFIELPTMHLSERIGRRPFA
jgi:peptidoglycan/LPS O-acetylase OafA/YrhL